MERVGDWFFEQWRTYFGNAGSVRDLRSNMRGWNTPVILFCYLGFMILASGVFYIGVSSSDAGGTVSISRIQSALNGFSMMVLAMTELLVGLIAPALVCASIVGEYQRRSIDLVFSSPVGTKYFLIGKIISSYRYVVLLIFMVLPVLALGVVLGGITMQWVMETLFLASLHGLLYTAVALPIACTSAKIVPAAAYSLIACVGIAVQPLILSIPFMSSGTPTFLYSMTPFMAFAAPGSTTVLFGATVPNWVLGTIAVLLLVRVFTVGAGSALSQAGSADTMSLRIHCLGLVALITVGVALAMRTSIPLPGAGGTSAASDHAIMMFIATCYIFISLPFLAVWSFQADRKSYPNGLFSLRLLLRGTPASGLPFLIALMLIATLGSCGMRWAGDLSTLLEDLPYVFASWSLVLLGWSMGWMGSLLGGSQGVAGSRRLLIAFLVLFFTLPWVILGWVSSIAKDPMIAVVWNPLTFIGSEPVTAWFKGGAMLSAAFVLGVIAELGRRTHSQTKELSHVSV